MDERYGKDASQRALDHEWIPEATHRGDVILCKDLAVAVNPLEAVAIEESRATVFVLAQQSLTGPDMARWFLANEARIVRRVQPTGGPLVYAVHERRLERIRLQLP